MVRSRPRVRRGTFALEPVDALPRLSESIRRLGERSLEANPFFLPEFLEPALRALGRKGLKLAVYSDRDEMRFFAPVRVSGTRLSGGPKLSVWTHPYAPLGSPLLEGDMAAEVADSLLEHLKTTGRTYLQIPELPLKGPVARSLRAAAKRAGSWTEAGRQQRPILHAGAGGTGSFEEMLPQKRRRDLDRQLRRLCETGPVSLMTARSVTDLDAAFTTFLQLEASGWKGRRGTALMRRKPIQQFARAVVLQFAQKGLATIDIMRLGDRPIAALIRFDHAGLSIPWKVAYDEEFASASPGKQLMCDETRRWLQDAGTRRVDPICEEGNPLMAGLWSESEPYGTLLLSPGRWGIAARLKAGLIDARAMGRHQAKALLNTRRRRPAPASKARPAARS